MITIIIDIGWMNIIVYGKYKQRYRVMDFIKIDHFSVSNTSTESTAGKYTHAMNTAKK